MPFTHTSFTASAAAPMGLCLMLPAFARATRAMGARMITTITNAAT
ncbi:MAG: hypothetical protein K2Q97_17265 [Burkholderiaceae bacterium]|nr:hypothetical protein [Burkholderiaceae bacterium]